MNTKRKQQKRAQSKRCKHLVTLNVIVNFKLRYPGQFSDLYTYTDI